MVTAFVLFAVSTVLAVAWVYFGVKGLIALFSSKPLSSQDIKRWVLLELALFAGAIFVFVLACFAGVLGFIALF